MLKAAVAGAGITVVLNIIPIVNWCCCLWVMLGSFLSVLIFWKINKKKPNVGQGTLCGLFSGLIALVIITIVGLVLGLAFQALIRTAATGSAFNPAPFGEMGLLMGSLVNFLIGLVIYPAFGALGGLIGGAAFGAHEQPPEQNKTNLKKIN
jgi:hypothetical protein